MSLWPVGDVPGARCMALVAIIIRGALKVQAAGDQTSGTLLACHGHDSPATTPLEISREP